VGALVCTLKPVRIHKHKKKTVKKVLTKVRRHTSMLPNAVTAREKLVADMLSERKSHPAILHALAQEPHGLTARGAQLVISRVYGRFRKSLLDLSQLMTDAGGGPRQFLAGIMFDHAMSLRRSIELAMELVKKGDAGALTGLEKLQRQYAELFGILSSGPSIQVGVAMGDGGARIVVSTKDESEAKSVLARMSRLTYEELDEYVMKHLPTVKAYESDEDPSARPVEATVVDASEPLTEEQRQIDRMLDLHDDEGPLFPSS